MKRKKVLFIATSHRTRGGITSVLNAYRQCPFWDKYRIKWIESHIDRSAFLKIFYAFRAFFEYLFIIWSYDLVHIHTNAVPSVKRKYPFLKVAKLLGKKVIVHLHIGTQIDSQIEKKADRYLYQRFFDEADAIIVLSSMIKEKISDLFGVGEKVYVVYNPCLCISDSTFSVRGKNILYAGVLNQNKGYSVLIEAFSVIANKYPEWKLVFAGYGEIKEAKLLASKYQISNQTEFTGWISGEKKDRLFRQASVVCLPSYAEGFPMTVLDAWAYKLPVVCTPVGGLRDILVDEKNALLFVPGDYKQLAAQLERIILDEALRCHIVQNSQELVETIFNLSKIGEQIDELYKKLLGE
ncbi:MAG: glycosyltransferase family 4 protein [Massilibacteroides sp.]|nr:glycosyltransferase family 4 protein [Massilibacteroides sp.]MDD3062601.1 glycosyltransferase family 4 protein [Massilibacteroides sp.]MDD4660132.1 glycosyltransferase family 4 protein [Massilibacteroides sp.]